MTANGFIQIAVFFVLILLLAKPMGSFMTNVFNGKRTFLHPVLRPLERVCYSLCGVKEDADQRWTQYAGSCLRSAYLASCSIFTTEGCRASCL